MKNILLVALILITSISCNRVKDRTKEVINEGGEVVGKAGGEFAEGVAKGVEETFQLSIVLSEELKTKGLQTGKYRIENASDSAIDNKFVLYMIFEKDFDQEVTIKYYDKNGLEGGRIKKKVTGKAGEAKFVEFAFDSRTDIELKSKMVIE
jgi:hypothetical protein